MKIIVTGDYSPQNRCAAQLSSGCSIEIISSQIRKIIKNSDYSIVNFESVIADKNDRPIIKSGPSLSSSRESVTFLKEVGFKCACLANNHFKDYGNLAMENTVRILQEEGISSVGYGYNLSDANKTLIEHIGNETLAVINCCEHEFSVSQPSEPGTNPINPIQQYYAINEARKHADYVIIVTHGGHEHCQIPSPRMKELYRFYIDCGADAIINSHQHCACGYEVYHDKPIFYGIGNFCFDMPNMGSSLWNEGYIVSLEFINGIVSFTIHPYVQYDENPTICLMNDDKTKDFMQSVEEINQIIKDDILHRKSYADIMNNDISSYRAIVSPYNNHYLRALCSRGYLPLFLSSRRKMSILNAINCESHLERLQYLLQNNIL